MPGIRKKNGGIQKFSHKAGALEIGRRWGKSNRDKPAHAD